MPGFVRHGASTRVVLLALAALIAAIVPAMAQNAIWFGNGAPTADEWNQLNNWSTGVLPTGTATFVNNGAPTNLSIRPTGAGTDVTLGALQFVGPGYTIHVGDGLTFTTLTLTGAGIIGNSSNAPTISVTFGGLNFLNTSSAGSATLNNAAVLSFFGASTASTAAINNNSTLGFSDASTAGSATITNNGLMQFQNTSTAGAASVTNNHFLTFNDASTAGSANIINTRTMEFFDTSTAGSASITNTNSNGVVFFAGASTAGSATINNNHNLAFADTSTAGGATIANNGSLIFNNNSSAGNAGITSNGSVNFYNTSTASSASITSSGSLNFNNTSTAGAAAIANTGTLGFNDVGTAGNAVIANNGTLNFYTTSTAGNAVITNNNTINFTNSSTAASAAINNHNGLLEFWNSSTAGNATIVGAGHMFFRTNSTAGNAFITTNNSLEFLDASTAGSATITNNNSMLFFTTSTAANAVITNNGRVSFFDSTTAGQARLINNALGIVDFSVSAGSANNNNITAGSIEGAGNFYLGANALSVGNNLNTTVSGVISDCGPTGVECFAHSLSPSSTGGALVKTGTGTLTLSGINTYSGGTIVSAGTLALTGAGTLGSSANAVTVSSGTLDLGGTTQTQNGGVTLTGGTISNGTLFSSGIFSVQVGSVSAALAGTGSLTKIGTGTLTLSGIDTYSGATTVNGGTLSVNGSIASSSLTTVNAGGTLGGNGTVGNTLINGGALAPGNSVGTLTVQGSLTFAVASSYMVEVSPVGADRTNVTGLASVAGTAIVTVTPGTVVSKQYTILNARGGVTGTFDMVVTPLPGILASLSYDANDVFLNFSLTLSHYAGLNGNQQHVADALTNFFDITRGIPLVFGTLTPAGLAQVSGETAAGSQQTTFDAMGQFMGVLFDTSLGNRGGIAGPGGAIGFAPENGADPGSATMSARVPGSKSERDAYAAVYTKAPSGLDPFAGRWSVWAAGFGGSQTTDGNAVAGSNTATSRVFGTAVGADYRLAPDTLAGFALAGGGTNFSVASGGTGRSDLFQAGAFVRHNIAAAYLSGALAYGWQDITTDRTVTIAGVDQLHAHFNANAFSGRAEAGYRFATPWMGLAPYAAGQFVTFDLPAYAEQVLSGANTFALSYASKSVTASRSELGLRADRSWALTDAILTLHGRAAWAYDVNPNRSIAATFQTLPGASFVVHGAAQAHDAALTTASAELKWPNGFSLASTFEGEFSDVTRSYAGKGVLRYEW